MKQSVQYTLCNSSKDYHVCCCAERAEEYKLATNPWWPARAATWDMTASCPEESEEADKENLELLNGRRGLVTHCVLSLCCPLLLSLLGHGVTKTFGFNFPKPLSGDWSQQTWAVLRSDLCGCCLIESRASAGMLLGAPCTRARGTSSLAHWMPGFQLPGQALLQDSMCWASLAGCPDVPFSIPRAVLASFSASSRKPQNDPQTNSSFCLTGLRSTHISA